MYVVREACDTKGNWRALLPIKEAAIRVLTITQWRNVGPVTGDISNYESILNIKNSCKEYLF